MTFISYAQNFEDVMLWRALQHVSSGFYIDIGAAWPDVDSVTQAFYQRGWHGINVEPNPEFFIQLHSKRPRDINLKLAISTENGQAEISIIKDTGLSTFRKDIAKYHADQGWSCTNLNVVTRTLSSIWKTYIPEGQDVHFLKLDVEGYEGSVIESNDWTKNRPWIILVEASLPLSQVENYSEWQSKLLDYDYEFVYADGLNRFYLANEHSGLRAHFTYPPNYFDGFQLASQHNAVTQLHEIEADFNELKELNKQLKAESLILQENLYLLANGRSMRVTKPLRLLLKLARKLKHWAGIRFAKIVRIFRSRSLIFDQNIGRFILRKPALIINRAYEFLFKKTLGKVFLAIYKHPKANYIVKNLLRRAPRLESTLRRIYTRIIYSSFSQKSNTYPKELAHLSSTAHRVYSGLKKAVDKHRGDDH